MTWPHVFSEVDRSCLDLFSELVLKERQSREAMVYTRWKSEAELVVPQGVPIMLSTLLSSYDSPVARAVHLSPTLWKTEAQENEVIGHVCKKTAVLSFHYQQGAPQASSVPL